MQLHTEQVPIHIPVLQKMQIGTSRLQKQRVDHAASNSDALVGVSMTIYLINRL